MLTPEQIAVIDNLPNEGKAPFLFSDEERTRLARLPLEEKTAPLSGEATAKILIGAPGSGKSRRAANTLEDDEVFVSYDELGAIYMIEEYSDKLMDIEPAMQDQFAFVPRDSVRARRELWLNYQNESQNIRAQTLKLALKGQFNIVVDTTSSSIGTKFLIAALRQLPFKEIKMEGMFAPFDISRERIESRPRPTSGLGDLVGKRIGALEWIPQYAKMVDRFDFSYNPTNGAAPISAFSFKEGEVAHFHAPAIVTISEDLIFDTRKIRDYLGAVKENPALVAPENVGDLDIEALMNRYNQATASMQEFLVGIMDSRPSPKPAPAPSI